MAFSSRALNPWLRASSIGWSQSLQVLFSRSTCTCAGSLQSKLVKNTRYGPGMSLILGIQERSPLFRSAQHDSTRRPLLLCEAEAAERRGEQPRASECEPAVCSTARLCAPPRWPPCMMALNYPCESAQGVVGLASAWKDDRNVRIERHNDAALCIARGVLIRSSPAEVVLWKDVIRRDRRCSSLATLPLSHILYAHGALLSAR